MSRAIAYCQKPSSGAGKEGGRARERGRYGWESCSTCDERRMYGGREGERERRRWGGRALAAGSQGRATVRPVNPHIYILLINPDYHFLIALLGLP